MKSMRSGSLHKPVNELFATCCLLIFVAVIFSGENARLPDGRDTRLHDDYYLFFARQVPRRITSWGFVEPPVLLLGNQRQWFRTETGNVGPQPIPRPGNWQLSMVQIHAGYPFFLPYFALTTGSGWHFRIGCRWDDSDHYYTFPSIALKRLKISGE
jgi:hypothetical protein